MTKQVMFLLILPWLITIQKRKSIEKIKINDMKSPAYIHQRVLNRDEIAVVCRNVRQNSATHEAVIDEK